MQIRVIVNGAHGKMGVMACRAIESDPQLALVARLGRQDFLQESIIENKADVVLDLTRADCVFKNTQTIIAAGAHPVIGTSGLQSAEIKELTQRCESKNLGGIIVPNFSIAAVLMMRFAAEAAKFFPEAEVIEAHHPQKLDAPSGTALKTAEMMAHCRKEKKSILQVKELIPGARGACHQAIPIHCIRLPGILAKQQVLFGSMGETLSITHETIDRDSFMPGLLFACHRVMQLNTLLYGLEPLLFPEDKKE